MSKKNSNGRMGKLNIGRKGLYLRGRLAVNYKVESDHFSFIRILEKKQSTMIWTFYSTG